MYYYKCCYLVVSMRMNIDFLRKGKAISWLSNNSSENHQLFWECYYCDTHTCISITITTFSSCVCFDNKVCNNMYVLSCVCCTCVCVCALCNFPSPTHSVWKGYCIYRYCSRSVSIPIHVWIESLIPPIIGITLTNWIIVHKTIIIVMAATR